jgi:hypothetical protein
MGNVIEKFFQIIRFLKVYTFTFSSIYYNKMNAQTCL